MQRRATASVRCGMSPGGRSPCRSWRSLSHSSSRGSSSSRPLPAACGSGPLSSPRAGRARSPPPPSRLRDRRAPRPRLRGRGRRVRGEPCLSLPASMDRPPSHRGPPEPVAAELPRDGAPQRGLCRAPARSRAGGARSLFSAFWTSGRPPPPRPPRSAGSTPWTAALDSRPARRYIPAAWISSRWRHPGRHACSAVVGAPVLCRGGGRCSPESASGSARRRSP